MRGESARSTLSMTVLAAPGGSNVTFRSPGDSARGHQGPAARAARFEPRRGPAHLPARQDLAGLIGTLADAPPAGATGPPPA